MDPKDVISEILETSFKLSKEEERIIEIFKNSGVKIDDGVVTGVDGEAKIVLRSLMDNLSAMAVIKISAKQIIRKSGISLH